MYASAHFRGHWSSGRSKPAVAIQSFSAHSWESRTPSRRCSGEFTRKRPPNDQNACPPNHGSGSWSSRITRRPASASSAVATSPARPPPTTITAASSLTGSLELSCHHLAVPPGMHVDIVCADLRLQELLAVYAERDAVRAPCDDA